MKAILVVLAASVLWAQPEDAAANSQRARELVVAGKAEEAIPIYLELAREFPDNAAILVNLSIAEFKAKHYRDAAAHASAALRLQPDSPAANLFLGSSYEELGEHLLALPPLERVLAGNPQERNARLMLAEALFNLERYEEAAAHFQKASELAPENPKVWYGLGRAFDALSENAFRQLENAGPESQYWHALVADQYLRQRRYGNAFTQYRLALEVHDTLRGVHAGLATVYERTGHPAWAGIETQRELQTGPDCNKEGLPCDFAERRFREIIQFARPATTPETLYWVYKAYAEMAHGAYSRLSELPPSLETHLHKAKTFDDEGLPHEAAAEWRKALKLLPGDLRIQTALAWSLFRAHEFSAALPVLTELQQKERDSRELNFLCGATLVNLDEPERAIPPLEAAIRLDENFLPAHAALGRALLQTSRPEAAIPHLKAALPRDEDASVHFGLLRAYQLAGRTEQAVQAKVEYQKALRAAETKEKLEDGGMITAP
ncbi:MAG TPA: tetratricopeptide repeat protein [Bryobacteraceae bacterium]|jgi:predicted Zn-dependent protease|nr:tetratricopeptide repeat protein [Bryobacteraceae bacterium]